MPSAISSTAVCSPVLMAAGYAEARTTAGGRPDPRTAQLIAAAAPQGLIRRGCPRHHLGGPLHGVDDALVPGAPAEVAGQPFAYLVISGVRVIAQQCSDRRDETRCAETAL